MNLQIFTRANKFIKFCVLPTLLFSLSAEAGWKVDFSRRGQEMKQEAMRGPASMAQTPKGFLAKMLGSENPASDIVILNTKKGFIPATVHLQKGTRYKVHVVNVNEGEKNVSFIMDAFSEHHATYYGKVRTFSIEPQQEGVFSFLCPETASQGQVVIYQPNVEESVPVRMPASASN